MLLAFDTAESVQKFYAHPDSALRLGQELMAFAFLQRYGEKAQNPHDAASYRFGQLIYVESNKRCPFQWRCTSLWNMRKEDAQRALYLICKDLDTDLYMDEDWDNDKIHMEAVQGFLPIEWKESALREQLIKDRVVLRVLTSPV